MATSKKLKSSRFEDPFRPIEGVSLEWSVDNPEDLTGEQKSHLRDSLDRIFDEVIASPVYAPQISQQLLARLEQPGMEAVDAYMGLLANPASFLDRRYSFDKNTVKIEMLPKVPLIRKTLHQFSEEQGALGVNTLKLRAMVWIVRALLPIVDIDTIEKENKERIGAAHVRRVIESFVEKMGERLSNAVVSALSNRDDVTIEEKTTDSNFETNAVIKNPKM